MRSWTGIPELKEGYRQLGPARFWALMVAILAWIGVGAWLTVTANWPGTCDHEGRRTIGFLKQLGCSPDLLTGGPREWALFLWLWSMPALVIGAFAYAFVTKRGIFKKSDSE